MVTFSTYFLHGLDSSSLGTKGRFFRDKFPHVKRPDFNGSLADRLSVLTRICSNKRDLIFIGSSYGGLLATCFALEHPDRVHKLILLAPALNYDNFRPPPVKLQIPTLIVVGRDDSVTPPDLIVPLGQATFVNCDVREVNDDHFLHKTFFDLDWAQLLRA